MADSRLGAPHRTRWLWFVALCQSATFGIALWLGFHGLWLWFVVAACSAMHLLLLVLCSPLVPFARRLWRRHQIALFAVLPLLASLRFWQFCYGYLCGLANGLLLLGWLLDWHIPMFSLVAIMWGDLWAVLSHRQALRRFFHRLYLAHQIGLAAAKHRARYDFIAKERKARLQQNLVPPALQAMDEWIARLRQEQIAPQYRIIEGEQGPELLLPINPPFNPRINTIIGESTPPKLPISDTDRRLLETFGIIKPIRCKHLWELDILPGDVKPTKVCLHCGAEWGKRRKKGNADA